MRSGDWSGPVSTDNVRVTVNGTVRPVSKVVIQSGMRDGHPASDVGESWCVESTIDWVAPPLVFSGAPHRFGPGTEWLPKAGDEVVIETGDGELGKWWVQHRGVIDDTTGSFADGTASSTTVDAIEDLSGRVQFGALLSNMTPLATGFGRRNMGLSSAYMVDRMYRNPQTAGVGWYATPPTTWQTVASATHIGSAWPEVGSLRVAGRSPSEPQTNFVGWADTSYGVAPRGVHLETLFSAAVTDCILSCSIESPWTSSGDTTFHVQNADGHGPRVRIDRPGGRIQFSVYAPDGSQTFSIPIGSATRVALYFNRDTTTQQTLILRTDDGREETRTTNLTGFPIGFTMDRIFIDTDTDGVAGWWMVEGNKPAAQRWATLEHVPTARIRRGADIRWGASRDLPFTMPSDWLAGQVDAECATMWLDEDGVMQWAGRGVLEGGPVVNTITSVRGVDDIQWEQRRRALARSVWVNHLAPQVRAGLAVGQDAWTNGRIDVGRSEVHVEDITVPAEQDWISLDTSSELGYADTLPIEHIFNTRHTGTLYVSSSGTSGEGWALAFNVNYERVGLRSVTLTVEGWSNIPTGRRIVTRFPDISGAFHGGDGLRLRCRGIVTWVEKETSASAGSIGPARYTHDAGWGVQNYIVDGVTELRTWLRTQVMQTTRPRITGLTIEHDPRHQIGDKIRVQDVAVTGVDYEQLIQQRTVTISATEFSETISGRTTVVHLAVPNGPLNTDWTSRHEPGGHTPITPSSDWTREAV